VTIPARARPTDEVVVCARKPEAERYRIPERLREGGSLQSRQSWAARAKSFEYVGATGIQSSAVSAVGPARADRLPSEHDRPLNQLAALIAVANMPIEITALRKGSAHSLDLVWKHV
jgi:hypothetical protein